jgi:hypothetical protein
LNPLRGKLAIRSANSAETEKGDRLQALVAWRRERHGVHESPVFFAQF